MQFGFGSGVLWAVPVGGTILTPIRFGALQDIQIDFSADMKDMYGQNQFALDVARGKQKITGKAKIGSISALTYNNVFFGQTLSLGQNLEAFGESITPAAPAATLLTSNADSPASQNVYHFASTTGVVLGDAMSGTGVPAGQTVSSFTSTTVTGAINNLIDCPSATVITFTHNGTATVQNSATFTEDLGLRYSSTGLPLTKVSLGTIPLTTGYYSVTAAGAYYVSPADAGSGMLADYQYTSASTGQTITGGNPLMGAAPRFRAEFMNSYNGNVLALTLYACISTKLSIPTKIDDYVINEFDFNAYADSSSRVFALSTTQQA